MQPRHARPVARPWRAPARALYPGSFIHVAASFEIPHVTYVDTDRRARRFFAAREQVLAVVRAEKRYDGPPSFDFIGGSYEHPLDLPDASHDLLVSLYAGFISKPCKRYLAIGGVLVANNSHGDAGLAAIDPDYALVGVLAGRTDRLRVSEDALDTYLVPKSGTPPTEEQLRRLGRGVAYTRPAVAYLFRRLR